MMKELTLAEFGFNVVALDDRLVNATDWVLLPVLVLLTLGEPAQGRGRRHWNIRTVCVGRRL